MAVQLYTWPTANGRKVHIMLEEVGLPYDVHPVDIYAGDQHEPAFERISPNRKIPIIIDSDPVTGQTMTVFESGAILLYLAERTGQFLPAAGAAHYEVVSWLFFQMSAVGPMLGQAFHWRRYSDAESLPAIRRYVEEAKRIYRVLETRLTCHPYVAGDAYSIADMAIYPWLESHEAQGIDMNDYPQVAAWRSRVSERPAVMRGMAVLRERRHEGGELTETQRAALFRPAQD